CQTDVKQWPQRIHAGPEHRANREIEVTRRWRTHAEPVRPSDTSQKNKGTPTLFTKRETQRAPVQT
ncbi:hypothetical protein, partial [Aromatoleum bremense]|uniref:hypothetical protein n=1 Tax=Aromatoleum bremense TaxID=76115 RepID=UPI001B7D06CC